MDVSDFDYYLPRELIAQEPVQPRDHSRLLLLNRKTKKIEHKKFYEILNYLSTDDVLIFNDSKVVPARLYGKKISTQGKAEILLIKPENKEVFDFTCWPKRWIIIGKPELREGQIIEFSPRLRGTIEKRLNYERIIEFNIQGEALKKEIIALGQPPLPPYIKHPTVRSFENYQTIFAHKEGSVAAPTAAFHFTPQLLKKIKEKGVNIEFVTLHIGLGTFLPVKVKKVEEHKMHQEYFSLSPQTAQKLNKFKQTGKRIIAVGTTVTRVLESCSSSQGVLKPYEGWTNLFIYPGYRFKFIDALITNFHLPKSTLLMLVCAFAGKDLIFRAYREAIKRQYRFFSFGDAMFIY